MQLFWLKTMNAYRHLKDFFFLLCVCNLSGLMSFFGGGGMEGRWNKLEIDGFVSTLKTLMSLNLT